MREGSIMRNPTNFLKDEYEELVKDALDWRLKTIQGPSEPVSMVDGKKVIVARAIKYFLGIYCNIKSEI
jgi:hypothetical protein